jgi:hypothetical protein
MDPHQNERSDLDLLHVDPHPDPPQSDKLDPDPDQFAFDKPKCMEHESVWALFQGLSLYLEARIRIRIRIKVSGRSRIRIKVKGRIRIRIKMKDRLRIGDADPQYRFMFFLNFQGALSFVLSITTCIKKIAVTILLVITAF